MRRPLRLHPVPLAAGIAVALLTLQLGNWQMRRAAEKEAMQVRFRAAAEQPPAPLGPGLQAEWRQVALRGIWLPERTILLDNRVYHGRPGFHVLTPLRVAGQDRIVLVNRGWIPAGRDRQTLPVVSTPPGEVVVEGRVRLPGEKPFTLGDEFAAADGVPWQTLDLARFRTVTGLAVPDFHVQQINAAPDGLVRDWPEPGVGGERHRGYAVQWYSLAALAALLTLWYVWNALRRILDDRRNIR